METSTLFGGHNVKPGCILYTVSIYRVSNKTPADQISFRRWAVFIAALTGFEMVITCVLALFLQDVEIAKPLIVNF